MSANRTHESSRNTFCRIALQDAPGGAYVRRQRPVRSNTANAPQGRFRASDSILRSRQTKPTCPRNKKGGSK